MLVSHTYTTHSIQYIVVGIDDDDDTVIDVDSLLWLGTDARIIKRKSLSLKAEASFQTISGVIHCEFT